MHRFERIEIVLRPITPTHVWSGSECTSNLDIVYDPNDMTYCIVHIDEVMRELRTYDLQKFSNVDELSQLISEVVMKDKRRFCIRRGKAFITPQYVRTIQNTLIPASSLKGLIRTAILYTLLKDIALRDNKSFMDIIEADVDLSKEPKDASQGLEARQFRKPRIRTQRGFVDAFQSLLISDPRFEIENIKLGIVNLEIYELDTSLKRFKGLLNSMGIEALIGGELHYDLTLTSPISFDKVILSSRAKVIRDIIYNALNVLSKLNKKLLEDSLRTFSEDLLGYEVKRIENIGTTTLEKYLNLLNNLKEQVGKDRCYPLRIGFGTGHMSKTIDILLLNYFKSFYDRVRHVMSLKYRRVWDERTIKLVDINGDKLGVGWVQVCLKD